ncbi:alpha/beta hydrolase [Ktedonobacteria bacterium brp13]|nr:alpha/beta hydrolase [Ktedonobacteria bacterium brp13]
MSTTAAIIFCIIGVIILVLIIASVYFCNVAVARQTKEFMNDNPDLAVDSSAEMAMFDPEWTQHYTSGAQNSITAAPANTFETLELKTYDGLTLYGYYLAAATPTTKIAILAHGYNSRALPDMSSYAQLYHDVLGYNILLPDDRGHGASEGKYIGLGWLDRLDYQKWIQVAIQKVGPEAQVVLHGVSMGGATVLMTSGEPLPANVKGIVSDCAYTSARDILSYQCRRMYKLPTFPLVQLTSLVCKLRAGYFFGEASALKQVQKAQVPILFIHGAEDLFVPTSMIHPLYDHCASPHKEKLLIPHAGHALAFAADRQTYTQRVSQFVENFVHA